TAVTLNNVGGTFTFRSITANGTGGSSTTGISLIGTTGSFTVTGDGSTANSGGTIQNEKGADQSPAGVGAQGIGLYMSTAQNVSLSFMHLHDFDNFAIQGTSVTNFSLSNVTIDGSNGNNALTVNLDSAGDGEAAVQFYNLLGAADIDTCTISGGIADTLEVVQTTGTLGLTINNGTISQPGGTGGNDAVDIFAPSASTATITLTATNNKFTTASASLLDVAMNASGVLTTTVTGNSFTNARQGLDIQDAGSGNMTFDIENNTFTNAGGSVTPLAVGKAVPTPVVSTTATGKIINNTVGTAGVPGSGSAVNGGSDGIELDCDGQGTMTVLVQNNKVHGWDEFGMVFFAEEGNATLNATVIGNTVDTPNNGSDGNSTAGMWFVVGGNGPPDANLACLHIGDVFGTTATQKNSITTTPSSSGLFDIEVDQLAPATQINFPNYTGAQTDPNAQTNLTTYLIAHNTLSEPSGQNVIFGGGDDNFHNTPGSADCAQPPLLFAAGGVEPEAKVRARSKGWSTDHIRSTTLKSAAVLDQANLDFIVRAAKARWITAGLSEDQTETLKNLRFAVGDLTDGYLGSSDPSLVIFDRRAAGHGWFIDRTPLDDKEFTRNISGTLLYTDPKGAPAGLLDLLTAVMHEVGHRLGLPDAYGAKNRGDVMYETLSVGERRLPAPGQAEEAGTSQGGEVGSGPDKQYILREVQGENTDEETKKYAQKLDQGTVDMMAQSALQRWQDAGVSPAHLYRLRNVQLQIVDLPGDELSVTTGASIQIDETAAGYGWFIDPTPQNESSFRLPIYDREYQADLDSPAFGRTDLLTVMMNAYGRLLKKKEKKRAPNIMRSWLMKPWLPTGVRRVPSPALPEFDNSNLPSQDSAASSNKGSERRTVKGRLSPQSAPVDVVVGTLPVGKSVIVKFQVTVNNPLTSPSTATSVSNTGSVAGTNFTTVSTNTDMAELCVPPVTTTPLTNQQVAQGTTATFTTTLTGSTPFTFVWKKNGTTLTSGVSLGGRATISTSTTGSSTTSTLTITGAIPSDSDTYTSDGTDVAACGDPAVHQSATLTVVSPPSVTKSFNPTTIPVGGTSTITLTITNPNTGVTLTGVNFSDNFTPGSGLQVASPAGIG
ncbi:MAG: immunoglobulin domain-containing protein, partial [Blastocatellia bacterium]